MGGKVSAEREPGLGCKARVTKLYRGNLGWSAWVVCLVGFGGGVESGIL